MIESITVALKEKLLRVKKKKTIQLQEQKILSTIGQRCAKLPDKDQQTPEKIMGYDQHGLAQ